MKPIITFLTITIACSIFVFGQTKPSTADTRFMKSAAEGGMAEVKLGQLAQEKASNQSVKDFGKRMVNDHTKANDQLKDLALKKGVDLPTSISAKDQATYDRLSKLSGSEFDREYMRDMVKDHQMDVSEFRRETQMAKDADTKAFAQQTLPTLDDHLNQAKQIDSQIGTTSRK